MSHFTVMVIGENPEEQLAPFNEDLTFDRYVQYTKEQLIEKGKKDIQEYKDGIYKRYLEDPIKYKGDAPESDSHMMYLEKEFPEKLKWTDEQIYQHEIKYYDTDEISKDGEIYSTRNPNAKWDWYKLGGRWSGMIRLKEMAEGVTGSGSLVMNNQPGIDQARKCDIENISELKTHAILKDGKWYERGEMGWWGVVHNEKDEDKWESEFKNLMESLSDDVLISIYDCHI